MGGAPAQSVLKLLGAAVDGDDRARAGQPGGGDHLQSHATAADDGHALADPHAGGMGDGAEAGDDPAPQQRRLP